MFRMLINQANMTDAPSIWDISGIKFALATLITFAVIPYALIFLLPTEITQPYYAEDGIIEWVGAALWFFATLLFMWALLSARHQRDGGHAFWYVCLMIITFIAGAEEISWGQRIFGFETPEVVASDNLQGEMNLHNMVFFDERNTADGENRKQGFRKLLTFHTLGAIIWFGYLGLLPLVYRFLPPMRGVINYFRVPVVPISISIIAIFGQVCFELVSHINRHLAINPEQVGSDFNEHKESLIALLFFLAALSRLNIERSRDIK